MARGSRARDILDVFTRSVATVGYDGTNFSSIADELGLSKGTLVHHFGTKERMLALVHESYMDRRLAELTLILDRLATPGERLAAVLHAFLRYQVDDRAATVAVHREMVRLADRDALAAGLAMREQYRDRVRRIVADGVATGEFRPVDPHLHTLLLFGSAQWMWTWFDPDGQQPADQVAGALVDLVLGSLLTDRNPLGRLKDPGAAPARAARAALADVRERYDITARILRFQGAREA